MFSKINVKPATKTEAKPTLEKPVTLTPDQIQAIAGGMMPSGNKIRMGLIAR